MNHCSCFLGTFNPTFSLCVYCSCFHWFHSSPRTNNQYFFRVVFYPLFLCSDCFFSFFFEFKFNVYYSIVTHFDIREFHLLLNMTANFVQLFCVSFLQLFLKSKLYKRGHIDLGTFSNYFLRVLCHLCTGYFQSHK